MSLTVQETAGANWLFEYALRGDYVLTKAQRAGAASMEAQTAEEELDALTGEDLDGWSVPRPAPRMAHSLACQLPIPHRTLSLVEAAAFLQMSPLTLRKKAAAGSVPASKPAKAWVFDLEELKDFLKAHKKCPSIAAPTLRTGGSVFKSMGGRSGSALAQRIAAQRKNLKRTRETMPGAKSN